MSRHTTPTSPATDSLHVRLERGLQRFHRLLRMLALSAQPIILYGGQRLVDPSLAELDLGEGDLARLYARDRLRLEGLEAIRNAQFELMMTEEARGAQGN